MLTKLIIVIVAILLLTACYLLLGLNFKKARKQKTSSQNQQKNKLAKQIIDKLTMIASLNENQELISKLEPIRSNLYKESIFSVMELEQLIKGDALREEENPIVHSLKLEILAQLELLK